MTAPVIDDAAVERAARILTGGAKPSPEVLDKAHRALTAAFAPEPTPLERAALTLFELNFEHSPSDGDDAPRLAWTRLTTAERVGWASDAKDVIDAWVKAAGPAPRTITREELDVAVEAYMAHPKPSEKGSMRAALATLNITVEDDASGGRAGR